MLQMIPVYNLKNCKNMHHTYKTLIVSIILSIICFSLVMKTVSVFAADEIDYNTFNYAEISEQIAKDVDEYHIPGMAVIVVNQDAVLFSETYGNCDNVDTPFIIGSMTKSFTALSVMQLVEQGKINIDDSIDNYIDCTAYLAEPADGQKITVRELLNHTSGLGRYQTFLDAKITNTRGHYAYSNVGYFLLGKVVEAVSGKSYADYVGTYIFSPLGMNHSAATLEESKQNGLIAGYRNYFGMPVAGEPDYPKEENGETVAAGYISSSISDMGRYLQMYLNSGESVISPESISKMFYDGVPVDESGRTAYGMGWNYTTQFKQPMLFHSGLVENYTSNMFIIPEKNIGIVVLVNMNDYLVGNNLLGNIIMPLLGEEKASLPGNAYLLFHALIDLVYLLIVAIAVYPLVTLKKWRKKAHTKRSMILDILRHAVLPILLLALPIMLDTPYRIVCLFVKDLLIVLVTSSTVLIVTGVIKGILAKN